MTLVVILVNYHSEADLLEAIESVKENSVPAGFERKIVVVDNDIPSDLKDITGVEVLRPGKNLGFAGANNLAIKKHPEADYYLLLNPDTKVSKDFLTNLLTSLPPNLGLASPKIYFYPGYEFHKDRYKKSDLGKVIWYGGGEIDWNNVIGYHLHVDEIDSYELRTKNYELTGFCTGCCLLIPKQVVDKIGLLDEKLFFSWEDTDYSVRAKRAGLPVVYVPNSAIWHKNANTSGGVGSDIQNFYQTRNRLIFAFRYARFKTKALLLWQLLKTANLNRLKAILSAIVSSLLP